MTIVMANVNCAVYVN